MHNGQESPANRSRRSSKGSGKTSMTLQNKVSLLKEYGGLGKRYYDKLSEDFDKILQVKLRKFLFFYL